MAKVVPIGFTSLSRGSARMRLKGDSRLAGDQGRVRDDFVANNRIDKLVQSIAVLIVDDNQYMRKVVRNILVNIGVKNIHEARDGIAGLEAIRMFAPQLVILDWGWQLLNGAELVAIVS